MNLSPREEAVALITDFLNVATPYESYRSALTLTDGSKSTPIELFNVSFARLGVSLLCDLVAKKDAAVIDSNDCNEIKACI